jgi:hypothetical protein
MVKSHRKTSATCSKTSGNGKFPRKKSRYIV